MLEISNTQVRMKRIFQISNGKGIQIEKCQT